MKLEVTTRCQLVDHSDQSVSAGSVSFRGPGDELIK